jgi:hypothetical protein
MLENISSNCINFRDLKSLENQQLVLFLFLAFFRPEESLDSDYEGFFASIVFKLIWMN